MKKTTLSLTLATALLTTLTMLNCSKKDEPAPATTTSGTTTSGSTTSGSTTSGTTTSGTTTSGTTTSGTTTAGTTTAGTTTSGTKKVTGTGTLAVDGTSQTLKGEITISEDSDNNLTMITIYSDSHRLQIFIGKSTLQDGIYNIDNLGNLAFGLKDAGLSVVAFNDPGAQCWSIKDASIKVIVSGKKVSVGTVNLVQYTNGTKKMTASCDITLN